MKAYAITMSTPQSRHSWEVLRESHEFVENEFPLRPFKATTPENVDAQMQRLELCWGYPWEGHVKIAGLKLHAYATTNRDGRIACFMSHYRLWIRATVEPILILEDDAAFLRKLDPEPLLNSPFQVIGINDPRGATRKSDVFHAAVQRQPFDICPAPWVDNTEVPQGLAGASAYLIRPMAARSVIGLAHKLGCWPNDALLCKQLIDGVGVTRTYYTKIQRTPSTLA